MLTGTLIAGLALSGLARCTAEHSSPAAEALKARFPRQAAEILSRPTRLTVTAANPGIAPPPGQALQGLRLTLPAEADGEIRLERTDGFGVRVREADVTGPGRPAGNAIAYARSNGHSYWAAVDSGYEEWLMATPAKDGLVSHWTVTGAALRQHGAAVELLDPAGAPRLRITAPAAYGPDGRPVRAWLESHGAELSLRVEARGETVLVDPLWQATAGPMTDARHGHTAAPLPNGQVLVAGGEQDLPCCASTGLASAELYDPDAGTWSGIAALAQARAWHTATLLQDGRILIAGGLWDGGALASAEVYDPDAGTWSDAGFMGTARWQHTATLLQDGTVLVAGGNGATPALTSAEIFNPDGGLWNSTGPLAGGRAHHTATRLPNGRVLAVGGRDGTGAPLQSAEFFDPNTGVWSPTPTPASPRAGHAAVLLPGGQVLVAGSEDGGAPTSAELYDPTTGNWSTTGSLQGARGDSTATVLLDGRVLAAGGAPSPRTAELYNPDSGTWTAAGCLTTPRSAHTATLLGNGKVLVAGGHDGGNSIASSELFDPAGAPLGSACAADCQCASGFCANGVCCNTACNGGACEACSMAAGASSDGTCQILPSTTVCRSDAGVCDLAATCDGTSPTCPANAFLPSTTVCRPDAGFCDVAETCTGSSAACPADSFLPSTTVCRPAAGLCDVAETCTGSSAACPADSFLPSTTVCRPAAGLCDVAETCTGSSAACPADSFLPSTTVCRPDAGACDVAETCTGSSAACPADVLVAVGGQGAPTCAPYVCNGTTASCPTSCTQDSQCVPGERCIQGQCVTPTDGGVDAGTDGGVDAGTDGGVDAGTDGGVDAGTDGGPSGPPTSFVGWHCGCSSSSSGGGAFSMALLSLLFARPRRRRGADPLPRSARVLGPLVVIAVVLASSLALASEPVGVAGGTSESSSAPTSDAPTLTLRGPGLPPPPYAPLHLFATSLVEVQSQNVGAEVGASYSFTRYTDLGLAAVLGPHIGGRLLFALHPGPDWKVRPVLQLRGVFHPVPGANVLGGGAGLGAEVGLGPGRLAVLAAAEVYQAPAQYLPTGLFGMIGYELDLLKPEAPPANLALALAPSPAAPSQTAPPTSPRGTAVAEAQPPAVKPDPKLRTDDLPPPAYTEPIPESRHATPAPVAAAPPPPPQPTLPAGQARVTVKLSIRDRILFSAGQRRIRSKYLPILKRLAGRLKGSSIIRKLRIDGYSDDKGSDATNLKLSEQRAREVMDFLIKNGVEPSRLELRAYGRMKLLMQETKKEQEENRRVEFTITDPPQTGD